MSTRVHVTNVCRFVDGQDSDFEVSDSSGDEWLPYRSAAASDDDEEVQARARSKAKKTKQTTVRKETTAKPSTSKSASDSSEDDEESLASIRRAIIAEDDLPLSVLAAADIEDDIPLAQLVAVAAGNQELDEDLSAILDEPNWTDLPFQPPSVPFKGTLEPPPADGRLKTPYEFFRDFVTDKMLDDVVTQTNIYSFQKTGILLKTTRKEIETFIGIYLRMGLIQGHSIRSYWEAGTRYAPVADAMGRDRFAKLASTLHFQNNMAVTEDQKTDKIWKLRQWLNDFRDNLKKIPAEEHNSVDEIMVAFKGKSALKQYIRGKPHPWGFKLWARAGISGILYDFDIYQGSQDGKRRAPSELGLGGDVVLQMVKDLPDGLNFKVFADNFFTNLALAKALRKKSIYFVGTFRANRLKGCQLKSEKELRKEGRGSSDSKVELLSNVIAVRWYDNKTVDCLSTYVGIEKQDKAKRYDKKEKKFIEVPRPAIIQEYNTFMGGVDLLDSLTALYKFNLKSKRWYMYILHLHQLPSKFIHGE